MAILSPSLQRRRSQPLSSLADADIKQQPQEPTKTRADGSPRQSFVSSGLLIRKVSSIFSGRSKRSKEKNGKPESKLKHAPIGHIAVGRPGLGGYESTTPSPSTESFESDIRQPSGLGRLRTGSLSSNGDAETAPYERVRALSTPTLLRPAGVGGGTGALGRRVAGVGRSVPRVPQPILNLIVSFLPRQHVPRVSLVSGAFCEAARATMFAHLDGRFIRPVRFTKLMSLLALRHDLALLVEALTIHVWPPSFYLDGETQISMLAPSTPSFAQSLLNMHRLKTLTLPSFEYTLMRYFSPLMLTKATFLNHTMSVGDQLQLRTWLECQEEIRHLSFPVLIERSSESPCSPLAQSTSLRPTPENTPLLTPVSPTFAFPSMPSTPTTPYSSARPRTSPQCSPLSSPLPSPRIAFPSGKTLSPILPHLETLSATPNLTTSLLIQSSSSSSMGKLSFPPLEHINLRVHKSLYAGLRPSTVMQAISHRRTRILNLRFSEDIDPRTMEKVLTSAGAILGRAPDGLVTLSVTVEGSTPNDEELCRMMSTVLVRFTHLQSLAMHRTDIPVPSKSGSLSDSEQSYVVSWARACSRLRAVAFASGAQWEDVHL
ncbi:F-box domain-containing protein [Pleurotus pulmonarius]